MKAVILLCSLALAQAGFIDYSPTSYSTIYSSPHQALAPVAKTFTPIAYTKTLAAPAPVYESVLATHESRTNNLDGSQQTTISKTLNTPFASVSKYDSRTTDNQILTHSVPIYSSAPVYTQPHTTYSVASPVTYHAAPVLTKTISTPAIGSISTPLVAKTAAPSLTAYASHQIAQPVKITYSEAPLVSHMTFTGLGTSYSW